MAKHVNMLNALGHQAVLATLRKDDSFDFKAPVQLYKNINELISSAPDLMVLTHAHDISVFHGKLKKLVFLAQGDQLKELEIYYATRKNTRKYQNFLAKLSLEVRFSKERRRLNKAYRTPIPFWCVSHSIASMLKTNFDIQANIIRNSIDRNLFYPVQKEKKLPTILCIGNSNVPCKNIPRALEAIRLLKKRHQIRFIKVSAAAARDNNDTVIDEHYHAISQPEIAKLCRESDILFSPSLQEGFGLPALESMACGTLCVLSDIPAYHSFQKATPGHHAPYALYHDPLDIDDMVRVLEKALTCAYDTHKKNALDVAAWYTEEGMMQDLIAATKNI